MSDIYVCVCVCMCVCADPFQPGICEVCHKHGGIDRECWRFSNYHRSSCPRLQRPQYHPEGTNSHRGGISTSPVTWLFNASLVRLKLYRGLCKRGYNLSHSRSPYMSMYLFFRIIFKMPRQGPIDLPRLSVILV